MLHNGNLVGFHHIFYPAPQSLINVNRVELIYHIVSNEMEEMGKKLKIQQFIVLAQTVSPESYHLLNR